MFPSFKESLFYTAWQLRGCSTPDFCYFLEDYSYEDESSVSNRSRLPSGFHDGVTKADIQKVWELGVLLHSRHLKTVFGSSISARNLHITAYPIRISF